MTSKTLRVVGRSKKPYRAVVFSILLLIIPALSLLPSGRRTHAHDGAKEGALLEVGGDARAGEVPSAPAELKVVSYNIRYRVGEDLKRLAAPQGRPGDRRRARHRTPGG